MHILREEKVVAKRQGVVASRGLKEARSKDTSE